MLSNEQTEWDEGEEDEGEEVNEREQAAIRYYLDEFYETGTLTRDVQDVVLDCGYSDIRQAYGGGDSVISLTPLHPEPEVDDDDFDLSLIADKLDPDRVEALEEGAEPLDEEIALWRDITIQKVLKEQETLDSYYFKVVKIWRISDDEDVERKSGAREMYFYALYSDPGEIDALGGPFRNDEELEAALNEIGNLRWG